MNKLWKKDATTPHPLVEAYTVGEDYMFDRNLLPFDILASKAHVKMLERINILTESELCSLINTLEELEQEFVEGNIEITPSDEDCHTVIENYLIQKLGDLGKKIHTGRSRNDQVLVALRLYMKDSYTKIVEDTKTLTHTFLSYAKQYTDVPLPGYSHTQQAMLSSVGHYMASFVESFLDDIGLLKNIKEHIDKNPLGSAAGFGVAFSLDRQCTTKELGFTAMQTNSLYCQSSRGKFEHVYMEGLCQIMMTLGRFATDMLFFTSQELQYFSVEDDLVTGSSIMPQKKNLDVLEIMRGNASVVMANQAMIGGISKSILSGYNRDVQLLKKPMIESTDIVQKSLQVMDVFVKGIKPNEKNIKKKITKGIFAADVANELVKKDGVPFRDAYGLAMEKLENRQIDIKKNIQSKVSLGASGNLGLVVYEDRLNRV